MKAAYRNRQGYFKKYYQDNKEKMKRNAKRALDNKSPIERKEYQMQYYQNNKEKLKEHANKYRQENREKYRAYGRKFYQEHREEILKKTETEKEGASECLIKFGRN